MEQTLSPPAAPRQLLRSQSNLSPELLLRDRQPAASPRLAPSALDHFRLFLQASRWVCLRWHPRGLLVLDLRDDLPNFPHSPAIGGRERHRLVIGRSVPNRSQSGF